jgi:hypothetical protein
LYLAPFRRFALVRPRGENRARMASGRAKSGQGSRRSIRPPVLFSQIQILTTKDSEHAGLNDFMIY